MCGLTGLLTEPRGGNHEVTGEIISAMTETLYHRGPDAGGCWLDVDAGVALGHRRLAIIDVSPGGAQPMKSACGRFVMTYNGEVYNFAELRAELQCEGERFRGGSDTEVILAACARWGVEAATRRFIGMFAFALWDRCARRLWLVRDRLGIKPLYWAQFGPLFLFGSELKALRAHPGWTPRIDAGAVGAFMRHGYIPAPWTIYEGVRKLEPGTLLELRAGDVPRIRRYWDACEVAMRGLVEPLDLTDTEAVDAVADLVSDAVRRRMVSDVPLGAFLSGGIDSSAVVAAMQAQSDRPVRTFSIGFAEPGYDEAPHARAVAECLGTDHTELYVDPAHALDVVLRIPDMFDEPFADSSQVPTFLVSELTRRHVTVSLSGDGGDELFAGYTRYQQTLGLLARLGRVPMTLRRLAAAGLRAVPSRHWDVAFAAVPRRWRPPHAGDRLHKLAGVVTESGPPIYRRLVSLWEPDEVLAPGLSETCGPMWSPDLARSFPDLTSYMQYLDQVTYLPDDILAKVDRTSMAVSLEARVPLLDHRLLELSWRLPMRLKVRDGVTKWVLRQVLHRHVPPALVDRPKMGFGVPIDRWLRGPLRDWAEALLDPQRLAAGGLLRPDVVRERWREHLEGGRNWHYHLWNVLMLEAWRERWG